MSGVLILDIAAPRIIITLQNHESLTVDEDLRSRMVLFLFLFLFVCLFVLSDDKLNKLNKLLTFTVTKLQTAPL